MGKWESEKQRKRISDSPVLRFTASQVHGLGRDWKEPMKLAKVIGTVVASQKYETLEGAKLLIIQPLTWEEKKPMGKPEVAVDTVQAGIGDYVFYVEAREASLPLLPKVAPVDASIVGIVDSIDIHEEK